jgi:hypothetical protein
MQAHDNLPMSVFQMRRMGSVERLGCPCELRIHALNQFIAAGALTFGRRYIDD